mmetsp:Transcript_31225/g.99573  ORF Transcript_31225/g.99573 Transcript_31225/m.99573 type:complete len:204 (-) Transcript_31225:136-747(-)
MRAVVVRYPLVELGPRRAELLQVPAFIALHVDHARAGEQQHRGLVVLFKGLPFLVWHRSEEQERGARDGPPRQSLSELRCAPRADRDLHGSARGAHYDVLQGGRQGISEVRILLRHVLERLHRGQLDDQAPPGCRLPVRPVAVHPPPPPVALWAPHVDALIPLPALERHREHHRKAEACCCCARHLGRGADGRGLGGHVVQVV